MPRATHHHTTHNRTRTRYVCPQVQRYSDDTFYAFTRGTTFVALTNAGSNSGTLMRTITYHPYKEGTKLCEMCAPPNPPPTRAHNSVSVVYVCAVVRFV